MSEPLSNGPGLTVLQHEGVWIVSDRFGHWTRVESARHSAEDVREAMTVMYRRGQEDAFAALRKLIGVKS